MELIFLFGVIFRSRRLCRYGLLNQIVIDNHRCLFILLNDVGFDDITATIFGHPLVDFSLLFFYIVDFVRDDEYLDVLYLWLRNRRHGDQNILKGRWSMIFSYSQKGTAEQDCQEGEFWFRYHFGFFQFGMRKLDFDRCGLDQVFAAELKFLHT